MQETETRISADSGVELSAKTAIDGDTVRISISKIKGGDCLLHWGLLRRRRDAWQVPPRSLWPEGSRPSGENALQTPFSAEDGRERILIAMERSAFAALEFVLYFPDPPRWDSHGGRNYRVRLPKRDDAEPSPQEVLERESDSRTLERRMVYDLETGDQLAVTVTKDRGVYRLALAADTIARPVLHWGVARQFRYEWFQPPEAMRTAGSVRFGNNALETPFPERDGLWRLEIEVPEEDAPMGIPFVLKLGDPELWIKDGGKNFFVPLAPPPDYGTGLGPGADAVAAEIVEREMSRNSWTLMHRFNLCYDLLDRLEAGDSDGLALLFVWLRYSALRQLDWQRNYNTKPRELGHAQDRLTLKLAERWKKEERDRRWVRLMMSTLGRGSDAQRVRDEVLHIMHRHRIKEVSGHFMEEWHQKLHNNTTPDDIVLCEAYLAFLHSDGSLEVFYDTLQEGGVTKERLESYERPIRSDPDFIPHLKDALIHDFENFLRILKEVHAGADLETAVNACRRLFDREMRERMDFLLTERNDPQRPAGELAEKIAESRRLVLGLLSSNDDGARDLIFLDLALEDTLRMVIERSLDRDLGSEELARWVPPVVENLLLSEGGAEFEICLGHWRKLEGASLPQHEWTLQAQAVLDRLGRAAGGLIDVYYRTLQPKAEFLGRAFRAEPWTVKLFSEEVVRARPAFALSAVIRRLVPRLRKSSGLGDWQVISRSGAWGEVRTVSRLRSIQEKTFERPTVLVADEVTGDEEIPKGITAVLTPDTTDIVSHLAIRARNARVLFATCYDADKIARLKSLAGRFAAIRVSAAGDVEIEESSPDRGPRVEEKRELKVRGVRPSFSAWAVPQSRFDEESFGGKANNLNRLKERLPEWIALPRSAGLPFGSFERVLEENVNRDLAERYEELAEAIARAEADDRRALLDEIRETILDLRPPDGLPESIRKAMESAGLEFPDRWEDAWSCIKLVWASKWNERAWLSRRANGIADRDLFMAVLIQEVVEADYGFVLHTANPTTGDRNEIFGELVPGLGETLVGNYPGRALSFSFSRKKEEAKLLSFPSKSHGLFGRGLIFRSDSNGEDLAEYAGAGLYDSFLLEAPAKKLLDYSNERLVWDEAFRREMFSRLAEIGTAVEEIMGSPQDIEGAWSKARFHVVQTRPQVGLDDDAR